MASSRVTSVQLPISSECNRPGTVILLVATDPIKRAVGFVPIQMRSCLPGKGAEGRRICYIHRCTVLSILHFVTFAVTF